ATGIKAPMRYRPPRLACRPDYMSKNHPLSCGFFPIFACIQATELRCMLLLAIRVGAGLVGFPDIEYLVATARVEPSPLDEYIEQRKYEGVRGKWAFMPIE
ncbi:MAG TPA: hypothetical protein VFV34_02105, partial [Blastocatellia bacterium]|nr:hypothetical protein [Blastocatellia bacterium]